MTKYGTTKSLGTLELTGRISGVKEETRVRKEDGKDFKILNVFVEDIGEPLSKQGVRSIKVGYFVPEAGGVTPESQLGMLAERFGIWSQEEVDFNRLVGMGCAFLAAPNENGFWSIKPYDLHPTA